MNAHGIDELVRDVLTRGLGIVGLLGVALIHTLDAVPTFAQLPYKGWLYVALIVSCIGAAVLLLVRASRVAWAAVACLVAGAILMYVYSRTVGLPGAGDDIGNWSEPLGLAALFVEGSVLLLSGYALAAVLPARARASARAPVLLAHAPFA